MPWRCRQRAALSVSDVGSMLQRIKAIIQRQQRMPPERDNHCLLFLGQSRGMRGLRPGLKSSTVARLRHFAIVFDYNGEGFDVISSTSYFARRIFQQDDNSEGSNFFFNNVLEIPLGDPGFIVNGTTKDRRFTQETRLRFDDGAILRGLSGIIGVFHQHKRLPIYNPGIFIQALEDFGFDPPYLADSPTVSVTGNSAILGELYYEVAPRLNITLGLMT
jgi:hypothetical protein